MYLELAEENQGRIIAKMSGVIWRTELLMIKRDLGSDFEEILKPGREVVLSGLVEYHPVYGLKFRVLEVDLSFTLGEIEKRKQETLRALAAEDLVDRNKLIGLPIVVQRIALIGAPDSAGWADFKDHLLHNPDNFHFEIEPFHATVQGAEAAVGIRHQLEKAKDANVDAVVIIRGGGSPIDLDVFNDYHLAKSIALYPLPVLTGIGHETDMHVADVVANKFFKTPTAVADYLLERVQNFTFRIWETFQKITSRSKSLMDLESKRFALVSEKIGQLGVNYTQLKRGELLSIANGIRAESQQSLLESRSSLQRSGDSLFNLSTNLIEQGRVSLKESKLRLSSKSYSLLDIQSDRLGRSKSTVATVHPDNLLKLGLAILKKGRKVLGPSAPISEGDELSLNLHEREIDVRVEKVKKWQKKN